MIPWGTGHKLHVGISTYNMYYEDKIFSAVYLFYIAVIQR